MLDEHDIVGLEREIDYIIRNAVGSSQERNGTAHTTDYNGFNL